MVTIFFDGLCQPNPGGTATFAFVIRRDNDPANSICGCGVMKSPYPTSNEAEYVALGKALRFLLNSKIPIDSLSILGDSRLVIEQLKGTWTCQAPNLVPLLKGCRDILRSLGVPNNKVKAQWIPREQNVEADALSRAAFVGYQSKSVPELMKEIEDSTKSKHG
jgi:ribonuclease HI